MVGWIAATTTLSRCQALLRCSIAGPCRGRTSGLVLVRSRCLSSSNAVASRRRRRGVDCELVVAAA